MKKWLIGFCVVIGLFFLLAIWVLSSLLYNEYEVLEANWGIKLPQATEVKDLLTTENSFHGDGEWFTLLEYSKPVDLTESNFVKLSLEEIANANNKIANFQRRTLEIRQNDKTVVDVFKTYDVKAEVNDYYYYEERNKGFDTIVLLYKTQTQQLYKYEWHQ